MNSVSRKMRKLFRNPHKFVSDMITNRKNRLRKSFPLFSYKKYGNEKYTVVSACYNVEKYIDDFFKSLVKQRLSFKENIFCVMVDDGSTDSTPQIIKKWQEKYPDNILYVYKENGGQASARNLGMQYVNTAWVTFADPDDFFDSQYFMNIDACMEKNTDVCMIGTHIIFYKENMHRTSDTHALMKKFEHDDTIVLEVKDIGLNFHLATNTAVLKTDVIKKNGIIFDDKVKPDFEDAHFLIKYLSYYNNEKVVYLKNSIYFYRKREDGTSTLDTAWQNEKKYYDVIKYGMLDALEKHADNTYVQYSVLYNIFWYIKYIVNNPELVDFLPDEKKEEFLSLLDECFSYIDVKTIMDFNLGGAWLYHKIGMLNCFKKMKPPYQTFYIEDYDPYKNELKIRYFCGSVPFEEFYINGTECYPTHIKTVRDDFLHRTFVCQRIVWIPLPESRTGWLTGVLDGTIVSYNFNGKKYKKLPVAEVVGAMSKKCRTWPKSAPWLFIDREIQADDNAEHLYRYVKNNTSKHNIYFSLKKNSHDWSRLEAEGFNLVEFGTKKYEKILRSCSKIVSSHIDEYVDNYFRDGSTYDKQFVWLQHGVIKDDLSRWLNRKKRKDIFVTTTQAEYESIAGDGNRYLDTDKNVRLIGLPRHDSLMQEHEVKKQILVMPTWRHNLMGRQISGNIRELNPEFMSSDYAVHWSSFLQSDRLEKLADKYGYEVIFWPHTNIQPYLPQFNLPGYIKVMHHYDGSIQKVFKSAAILVTDYSSVAFEMAFLRKPVIYYQFDEVSFFGGAQVYQKGYFDYRKDGFGPVVTEQDALLAEAERLLEQGGTPSSRYLEKMEKTFIFHDGKNCERAYNAILSLEEPNPEGYININILKKYIVAAIEKNNYPLMISRISKLEEAAHEDEELKIYKTYLEFITYLHDGNIVMACRSYDDLMSHELNELKYRVLYWKIWLDIAEGNFKAAFETILNHKEIKDYYALLILCMFYHGVEWEESLFSEASENEVRLAGSFLNRNWDDVLEMKADFEDEFSKNQALCVLFWHAAGQVGNTRMASHFSDVIKKEYGLLSLWYRMTAMQAAQDNETGKDAFICDAVEKAYNNDISNFPKYWLEVYVNSLIHTDDIEKIEMMLMDAGRIDGLARRKLEMRAAFLKKDFEAYFKLYEALLEAGKLDTWFDYACALKNIGRFHDAYEVLAAHPLPEDEAYWAVRVLLAEVCGKYDDAIRSIESRIAVRQKAEDEDIEALIRLKMVKAWN